MVELGVFLPVLNNGYIISTAAPQYQPSYAMNKAMMLLAEDLGFRFVLSPVKYRGYGGPDGGGHPARHGAGRPARHQGDGEAGL